MDEIFWPELLGQTNSNDSADPFCALSETYLYNDLHNFNIDCGGISNHSFMSSVHNTFLLQSPPDPEQAFDHPLPLGPVTDPYDSTLPDNAVMSGRRHTMLKKTEETSKMGLGLPTPSLEVSSSGDSLTVPQNNVCGYSSFTTLTYLLTCQ